MSPRRIREAEAARLAIRPAARRPGGAGGCSTGGASTGGASTGGRSGNAGASGTVGASGTTHEFLKHVASFTAATVSFAKATRSRSADFACADGGANEHIIASGTTSLLIPLIATFLVRHRASDAGPASKGRDRLARCSIRKRATTVKPALIVRRSLCRASRTGPLGFISRRAARSARRCTR